MAPDAPERDRDRSQSFQRSVIHRPRAGSGCGSLFFALVAPCTRCNCWRAAAPGWWFPGAVQSVPAAALIRLRRHLGWRHYCRWRDGRKGWRGTSGSGSGIRGWNASARTASSQRPYGGLAHTVILCDQQQRLIVKLNIRRRYGARQFTIRSSMAAMSLPSAAGESCTTQYDATGRAFPPATLPTRYHGSGFINQRHYALAVGFNHRLTSDSA